MHRSHGKELRQLIIKKDDLKSIWALLRKYYDADTLATQTLPKGIYSASPTLPRITVVSIGGMTTEDDSGTIFDNDVIDFKKSIAIKFRYSTRSPVEKTINIDLKEAAYDFENTVSVSGDDPAAVDATYSELERAFAAIAPQSTLFRRMMPLSIILLSVSLAISCRLLFDFQFRISTADKPSGLEAFMLSHQWALSLFGYFLLSLIFLAPALLITFWVSRLWPSVEFDFGPEHFKKTKAVRMRLGAFFLICFMPILITAFTRVFLGWK